MINGATQTNIERIRELEHLMCCLDPADPLNIVYTTGALKAIADELEKINRSLRSAFDAIGP